jgi:hypothetical protein
MVQLRLPMLFNLRSDPFERAQHESGDYVRWFIEHAFVVRRRRSWDNISRASYNFHRAKDPVRSRSSRRWNS